MSDLIDRQAAIDESFEIYMDGQIFEVVQVETLMGLPSEQPEIIRCRDCRHRPVANDDYDADERDCGFNIEFPDYRCPCQCDDGFYNRLPDDNWFCGNAERKEDEQEADIR